jgi:hypothetical protein
MQNSRMSAQTPVPSANLVYTYRPSLTGAPSDFKLTASGLQWSVGRKSGLVPFGQIRRVRMAFRPAHMQPHRFITTLWADGAPKLKIVSTSWKSMMQQERFDELYSAFVTELHCRLAQANSAARFEQGSNMFIYWLGVIAFAGVGFSLAGLIVRALQADAKGGAAFIAAFMAFFLWQGGDFIRRNRPGIYRADALPAVLMPKG